MDVKFIDNRFKVERAIDKAIDTWLEECAGELEAQVKRNTRVDTGRLKGSWNHKVDANRKEAIVGSPEENAIWEEFGTGEYALEGKGRKGGWYIPIGYRSGEIAPETVAKYHFQIRKGKNGKEFVFTRGKKPSRALYKAGKTLGPVVRASLERKLKGLDKE